MFKFFTTFPTTSLSIVEGAQGIRAVSRLAFFHNHRQIKTAIETAEQRTRGHESKLIQQGLVVENELSIFIVGSLCVELLTISIISISET